MAMEGVALECMQVGMGWGEWTSQVEHSSRGEQSCMCETYEERSQFEQTNWGRVLTKGISSALSVPVGFIEDLERSPWLSTGHRIHLS
jgi:hypothetical protein